MSNLAALFDHNRWANEQLLEACRALTPEQLSKSLHGTYGELSATLAHIVSGEVFYVELLTGWKPDTAWQQDDPFPGIDQLLEVVRDASARLATAATTIPHDRPVEHDEGEVHPASVIVVQAINHATEHRAHVKAILTQLGIEPPALDGWQYGGDE